MKILVATSGDTGGAVAAAFHQRAGIEVAVLFPKGLVSPTQERQLTCWGDNVKSFAVRGTFDDCQRLVTEAFLDQQLAQRAELSSANSINLGRLLPQMVYYAASSLQVWREYGEPASYVIPSGNLGNAVACLVADRDWGRLRLARMTAPGQRIAPGGWGPVRGLRFRPWRLAAGVMRGRKVAPGVRMLVVPGSQQVKRQAEAEGRFPPPLGDLPGRGGAGGLPGSDVPHP